MNHLNKPSQLDKIAREIENCKTCKVGKIGLPVPGEGNPDADVVFIGEAPGKTEAKTGRPFVGRSGKLLRETIRSIGLKEEDVFITSPVKYLPLRGTPSPADIKHGKTHLDKQLQIINPKVIVLLGSVAIQAVLGKKIPVLSHHGEMLKEGGKTYFITIHPAAAIRFQKLRKVFESDFSFLNPKHSGLFQ